MLTTERIAQLRAQCEKPPRYVRTRVHRINAEAVLELLDAVVAARRDDVCLRWTAALVSEGRAAELLGVDRVTARGIRQEWAGRHAREAEELEEMVGATDPETVRRRDAERDELRKQIAEAADRANDAQVRMAGLETELDTLKAEPEKPADKPNKAAKTVKSKK